MPNFAEKEWGIFDYFENIRVGGSLYKVNGLLKVREISIKCFINILTVLWYKSIKKKLYFIKININRTLQILFDYIVMLQYSDFCLLK